MSRRCRALFICTAPLSCIKMQRISEKVKDVVEVRQFSRLRDLAADPELTLRGYHFTDITADLMAKWLRRIAGVRPGKGAGAALAGFRGVGKSHFLATVAAIVANSELRTQIKDEHVAASSAELSRRPYPVAFVRRGSGATLFQELVSAFAETLGRDRESLGRSVIEVLQSGVSDVPMVLVIDTAAEREARVSRDDGALLAEIAEAAKELGFFVGLALDDDISGADGRNSAIVASYAIDYLDQEHLFKIVDSHIFAKQEQMRPLLHDIYEGYRATLAGFRWSEQRFSALYPLHPATLEIAPLIRLYLQDFALLSFASEAGMKILGRPANSLIALDEIFDSVEKKLRDVPRLSEAFAAFDQVDEAVVARTPVKARLKAKLVLKGLFLLSLNGQGCSADDIAAAMMILDDDATSMIGETLETFAKTCPAVVRKASDNTAARYSLQLNPSEQINDALDEASRDLPVEAIWQVLFRQAAEKFSDLEVPAEGAVTLCTVEWRGGLRRGLIHWNAPSGGGPTVEDLFDWQLVAGPPGEIQLDNGVPTLVWVLADLTPDEMQTLRRAHVLQQDPAVRERFADTVATAGQVHSIAVERIWQRVFLADAFLSVGEVTYQFPAGAASMHTLAHLLTEALAPWFESLYPGHPTFAQTLGNREASALVASFFGRSGPIDGEAERLARTFAKPLGLAHEVDGAIVAADRESLRQVPLVGAIPLPEDGAIVPLRVISQRLGASPFGLPREAVHVVLASLVSQRRLEFVTTSGDRINHRSLDLQLIWDDIAGVALPSEQGYSVERLYFWAKALAPSGLFTSLDGADNRAEIGEMLQNWYDVWNAEGVLAAFDSLPDDVLTTRAWYAAATVRRSFGRAADIVAALAAKDISLEDCLQAIGELFMDSEEELARATADLTVVKDFLHEVALYDEVAGYLSTCDVTRDDEVEKLRGQLTSGLLHGRIPVWVRRQFETCWEDFRLRFDAHYAARHDEVIGELVRGRSLANVTSSQMWSVFDQLNAAGLVDPEIVARSRAAARRMRDAACASAHGTWSRSTPGCECRLTLADLDRLAQLPGDLREIAAEGIRRFRRRIVAERASIESRIRSADSEAVTGVEAAIEEICRSEEFPRLSAVHLSAFRDLFPATDHIADEYPVHGAGPLVGPVIVGDVRTGLSWPELS